MNEASRLVLGGHSFIEQLGSDPMLTEEQQVELVGSCLDAGITWFDTTYQPERIALGRALERLGRRSEATIIAWNFFTDFKPGEKVGGASCYQPCHITLMLEQLRTGYIDCLVVHGLGDFDNDRRQERLAVQWKNEKRVKRLGVWHPGPDAAAVYTGSPYDFMVRPYNVTTPDAGEAFTACKKLGWETLACSPFVRGWELEKRSAKTAASGAAARAGMKERLADHLLRYSLYAPGVDRLIIAMRNREWVARNCASAGRGTLLPQERQWLERTGD